MQVRVINPGEHGATIGIDHLGPEHAHLTAILHVEDGAEASVLDDDQACRFAERREVSIDDDGLRHVAIVVYQVVKVNEDGVNPSNKFSQHC